MYFIAPYYTKALDKQIDLRLAYKPVSEAVFIDALLDAVGNGNNYTILMQKLQEGTEIVIGQQIFKITPTDV